jgi:hypothetical protein
MSYKTVVVHVDSSVHASARIRAAAAVAKVEGAHLIGTAMTGISRFAWPGDRAGLARTILNSADRSQDAALHAKALSRGLQARAKWPPICRPPGLQTWPSRAMIWPH